MSDLSLLSLPQAVTALQAGQVIAYPTEAVYGLGCDPFNEAAMARIWTLKQRPSAMGVIVVAGAWEQLLPFMSDLSSRNEDILRHSWPAPMTWIVPARSGTPDWLTGGRDTIALRWTDHSPVVELCSAFGGALVSTSANLHGYPPAKSAQAVWSDFEGNSAFSGILAGELGERDLPTPIRELTTGYWIRK